MLIKNEQGISQKNVKKISNANSIGQGVVIDIKEPLHLGDEVRLPKKNAANYYVLAKIESIYFSALGKQCIQLKVLDTNKKRLFCQKTQSKWIEMPLLDNLVINPVK